MDKLVFGKTLLGLLFLLPGPVMAGADVDVQFSLPPPIVFAAPPALVVLPETYVYVVPDAEVDIFFYDGWWWRPWEGRWYRSQNYNSGWRHYKSAPSFYGQVPSGWRNDYRNRRWRGHEWDHRPIPHEQVKRNWNGWKKDKHWEKQNSWGVRDLKSQSRSQQSPGTVQQKRQNVQPRGREAGREEPRDVRTQKRSPQPQRAPDVRQRAKPQSSQQPSRDLQKQAPDRHDQQRSKSQSGKAEKERKEKQDKNHNNKRDGR
ncbi:MAG: hypothetical protein R6W75_06450 [Smithellaceae bacterium]